MFPALHFSDDTTRQEQGGNSPNSSDQESTLSCEQTELMPCSFGESSSMTADSKESTALCSETKAATYRQSLSDRLTPLLISRGLVKGTTPSWIRRALGAPIQGSALWPLDGSGVGVGYRCRDEDYPDDPEFYDEHSEPIEPTPIRWQSLPAPPAALASPSPEAHTEEDGK